MTLELVKNLSIVSEHLAMATNATDNYGLLPLDLQSTNNIVTQVRLNCLLPKSVCYVTQIFHVLESSTGQGVDIPSDVSPHTLLAVMYKSFQNI